MQSSAAPAGGCGEKEEKKGTKEQKEGIGTRTKQGHDKTQANSERRQKFLCHTALVYKHVGSEKR